MIKAQIVLDPVIQRIMSSSKQGEPISRLQFMKEGSQILVGYVDAGIM